MWKSLKKKKKMIDKAEEAKPVDKKDIENVIKLVEVAQSVNCYFKICLSFSKDEFMVTSTFFKGIKLINNKKDGDKLLIQYNNTLYANDAYFDLDSIIHIHVVCQYQNGGVADV